MILLHGCAPSSTQPERISFVGEAPTEATLLAPGIVSDSTSMEFGISFTPDMGVAYFTSQKPEDDTFFIYEARYEDGEWVGPVVAPFSGEFFDADPFVAHDGSGLLFFSMRRWQENHQAAYQISGMLNARVRDGANLLTWELP